MHTLLTQAAAMEQAPLADGETARFWREAAYDDLECLSAVFRTHAYAPHSHETYVMGIVETGCETFRCRGARHYAGPGMFCLVNPEEVHDGEPHGAGYAYRMIYPSLALVRAIGEELTGRTLNATPRFRTPVAVDRPLARRFAAFHRALEAGTEVLERDERTVSILAEILARHADLGPAHALGDESGPLARVRERLDAIALGEQEAMDLPALARLAGLSRTHLVRAFRRQTGFTPHAYLIDRRVRRAREFLRRGMAPADVAALAGFADQAHLTRAFKARYGVTPGVFRRAS